MVLSFTPFTARRKATYWDKALHIYGSQFKVSTTSTKIKVVTHSLQMEDQIRSALASKDYALAQTLADEWLNREPNIPVAHYFAAWARDAQGFEAEALVHYEKAFSLGITGQNLRGALLGAGSTCRNLGQFARSEELLRKGIHEYSDVSEFSAFLALTLYSVGRFKEAISILLKLLADTGADAHIKRYDRALRYYAANPDAN